MDWTAYEWIPDWRSVCVCPEEVCHLPSFIMKLLGLHKFVHGNFFVMQRFLCAHWFLHFTVTSFTKLLCSVTVRICWQFPKKKLQRCLSSNFVRFSKPSTKMIGDRLDRIVYLWCVAKNQARLFLPDIVMLNQVEVISVPDCYKKIQVVSWKV
jgi:hypothetical protein